MGSIATSILAVIAVLLWAYRNRYLAAGANDWVILETHKIDPEKGTWDQEEPLSLEFVPVVAWEINGWQFRNPVTMPITPPVYHVKERLNANRGDKSAKHETHGYWVRDGAIFDIDDMRHSDLWERLFDYAFAGHDIKVHGDIPFCYRLKFSEIMGILVENRRKKSGRQDGT
jgi:hypothetical protein